MKTTKSLKAILILAGALFLLFNPLSSKADTITYYFTSDHITNPTTNNPPGYGGPGPFGTVVLVQDGADVDFTVTLYDGSKFMRSGAGDSMNFKFNGTGVSVEDISGSGLTAATGSFNGDGAGDFDFGVYFTGQPNGGGAALPGPIVFTVAGATIAELTAYKNSKGQVFAADIISGKSGYTGLIDASTTTVPEPGILILLGIGMSAVGIVSRYVRKL